MTISNPVEPAEPPAGKVARLGREDPLLQELWAAKAALNAAAGHDIARLVEAARRFDLEATLARLRQQAGH